LTSYKTVLNGKLKQVLLYNK